MTAVNEATSSTAVNVIRLRLTSGRRTDQSWTVTGGRALYLADERLLRVVGRPRVPRRGVKVEQAQLDRLTGGRAQQPRRVRRPAARLLRDDARQVAAGTGRGDLERTRPATLVLPPRYHCNGH